MPNRSMPGLGLRAFDANEDGWGDEYNADHQKLSALVNRRVKSRTTSLPGSPSIGDIYIVPVGDANANAVAIWDGEAASEAWVYLTPNTGWHLYVVDDEENVQWTGAAWEVFAGAGGGGSIAVQKEGVPVVGAASTFNFKGFGVDVENPSAGVADVEVSGGGGTVFVGRHVPIVEVPQPDVASGTIFIEIPLSNDYDEIWVDFQFESPDGTTFFSGYLSVNGGSSFDQGASDYGYTNRFEANGAVTRSSDPDRDNISFNSGNAFDQSGLVSGRVIIRNHGDSNSVTRVQMQAQCLLGGSGAIGYAESNAQSNLVKAHNHMRLLVFAGIENAKFFVSGVKYQTPAGEAIPQKFNLVTEAGNVRVTSAPDLGKRVEATSDIGAEIILPADASDDLDDGFNIHVVRIGSGDVELQAEAPATLNGVEGGRGSISAQFGEQTVYKRGDDEWVAPGVGVISTPVTSSQMFGAIGQSNMAGFNDASGDVTIPDNAFQIARSGGPSGEADEAIIAAELTLDFNGEGPSSTRVGPVPSFLATMRAANPDATILIEPGAHGGTGFTSGHWNASSGTLYSTVVSRMAAAKLANPEYEYRAMLVSIGEDDSEESMSGAAFQTALLGMIDQFRTDLGEANLPFVFVPMTESWAAEPNGTSVDIQAVIKDIPNLRSYTAVIDVSDLETSGDIHYGAAQCDIIGLRLYGGLKAAEANTP